MAEYRSEHRLLWEQEQIGGGKVKGHGKTSHCHRVGHTSREATQYKKNTAFTHILILHFSDESAMCVK